MSMAFPARNSDPRTRTCFGDARAVRRYWPATIRKSPPGDPACLRTDSAFEVAERRPGLVARHHAVLTAGARTLSLLRGGAMIMGNT